MRGLNVELVGEFAKDAFWDGHLDELNKDQLYMFASQNHRIKRLIGKVDYIITDSPVILYLYYGRTESDAFKELVLETHKSMDSVNIFISRVKPYMRVGRSQSEEEAREIDVSLMDIVDSNGIEMSFVSGDSSAAWTIMEYVLRLNSEDDYFVGAN